MQAIKFTQTITLCVDIEALVPDDWSVEDIEGFANDCPTSITVNPTSNDYKAEAYDGATIEGICLDSAVIEWVDFDSDTIEHVEVAE